MKGVVTKSTGSWYTVKTESEEKIDCRIKGRLRIKGLKATNPIAVGDVVEFELEKSGKGIISSIEPRKNYIIRKATKLSKQTHIIATNIDQLLLIVSLAQPRTPLGFVDRMLITAEAYSIPAIVVCNKVDLMDENNEDFLLDMYETYTDIGYEFIATSVPANKNLGKLKAVLQGKTTLVSGQSGVGKSTLINAIESNLNLKTADISTFNEKGIHTTTFAEMFELSFGGSIIDTPGIRSFGIIDFEKEELYHYFPEIFKASRNCKFHNCQHIDEPKCAVKEAVENSEIAESRYDNYLNLYYDKDVDTNFTN
ncbi:MAG: ribosome small subunit-dependent GTPase A [Flavobacteriales bacterium]|nr:MAG: ribosome small subunit-dependent GTPase A [Flavobacteriales bacterium]